VKKICAISVALGAFCLALPLPAQMLPAQDFQGRAYLGGGLLYDLEDFSGNRDNLDWENSWGLNLKGGYFFSDHFALEGLLQYHLGFEASKSESIDGISDEWDFEVSLWDFTANAKVYIPLESPLRPYAVGGIGYATAEAEAKRTLRLPGFSESGSESESESDFCGRIGAGLDIFISDDFGLEFEVAYNLGLGDLDDFCFISLNLAALYAF